jgi:hypothetical protein
MKKVYMKPAMKVIQSRHTTLLVGSGKGVYAKVGSVEQAEIKYGGYIEDPDKEEEMDPD